MNNIDRENVWLTIIICSLIFCLVGLGFKLYQFYYWLMTTNWIVITFHQLLFKIKYIDSNFYFYLPKAPGAERLLNDILNSSVTGICFTFFLILALIGWIFNLIFSDDKDSELLFDTKITALEDRIEELESKVDELESQLSDKSYVDYEQIRNNSNRHLLLSVPQSVPYN